jgi:hypothetical protein
MSNKFYTQYKIDLLEQHSTSRELYQVLAKATEEFHWVTNDDSLFVDDTPLGAGHEIETIVSLLSDLAQYNQLARCDATIPDDLAYITPFIGEAA